MPLTNLYISSYSDSSVLNGATTGDFGSWETAGVSWSNGNVTGTPTFSNEQPNIFDGVASLHTGGLPRAYMLELVPQVPEGVEYPIDGWMSFCTLDLKISGHYGHVQDPSPLGNWDHVNDTMTPLIGTDTYTHQYNPLWQTEFDPFHGTTPIQNVNGGTIMGPWSGIAQSNITPTNYYSGVYIGVSYKYWYEATVTEYGDQSITNPYTTWGSYLWPCDPNSDLNPDCDPSVNATGMHGTAVEDGQDAKSKWDPRVSHIVAFNTHQLYYLGNEYPNVREYPYSGTMTGLTGVPTYPSNVKKCVGVAQNKVIVIVVLKPNIVWNNDSVADLGSVINIDFDGNAFFMGNNHLVLDPGEPVEDEDVEVSDPGTSTTTTTTTASDPPDTGAEEEFESSTNWEEIIDDDIGVVGGSAGSAGFGIE